MGSGARSLAVLEGSLWGRSSPLVSIQRSLDWKQLNPPSASAPARATPVVHPSVVGPSGAATWLDWRALVTSLGKLSHPSVSVQGW